MRSSNCEEIFPYLFLPYGHGGTVALALCLALNVDDNDVFMAMLPMYDGTGF